MTFMITTNLIATSTTSILGGKDLFKSSIMFDFDICFAQEKPGD